MDARRRNCAIAWALLIAIELGSWLGGAPLGIVSAWLVGLVLTIVTSRLLRGADDERLVMPLAYRVAAMTAFAAPLAGALLAEVPGAGDVTRICAVYFAVLAWLGYRAVVARGPGRAVSFALIAQILAVPLLFLVVLASMGCKCGPPREPPWTDHATFLALLASQLCTMMLPGVAVIAFRPRDPALPEAWLPR